MIRLCLGLGIALGIAACSPPTSVRSIALLEGEIIAITPDGYCVDGEISKPGTGFAVMAPCATLGEPENAPDIIGFATVQVGPRASGAVTGAEIAMRDVLITEAGAGLAVAPLQDGPGAGLLKLILAGVQAATESLPESVPEV